MNENIVRVLRLAKERVPEWQINEDCVIRTTKKYLGVVTARPFCPLEAAAGYAGWRNAAANLNLTIEEAYLIAYAADNVGVAEMQPVRAKMLEIFGLQEPPGC